MGIIAKLVEQTPVIMDRPKMYELFIAETVKDVESKDVQIPRSLGRFTLEELEKQKAEIEAKIAAIKAVK